jgi:hypothetical protein
VGLGVAVVDGPPRVGVKDIALGLGLNSGAFALKFLRWAAEDGDVDFGAVGIFPAAGPVGTLWGCSGIGTGDLTDTWWPARRSTAIWCNRVLSGGCWVCCPRGKRD